MMLEDAREAIGAAVARIPSGCSILTVEHRGQSTGMLVSWVQQASLEPICLTVCIKQGRPAGRLVSAAERFVLNIVGDDPTAMFKHFGKGFALEEDAFSGVSMEPTDFGPALTDCIAHLGCVIRETVTAGDHDIHVVEVAAARADDGRKPYVHIRKSGLSY